MSGSRIAGWVGMENGVEGVLWWDEIERGGTGGG